MNSIAFAPLIDVPLVVVALAVSLWHLNQWALGNDVEGAVDIASKLPTARFRIVLFFVLTLIICWAINVAVWAMFAFLIGFGVIVSLVMGAGVDGVMIGPWTTLHIVREWAFGFPQFILQPPARQVAQSPQYKSNQELVGNKGVTTTSLRPTGEALVEGAKYALVAEGGGWIDAGTSVEVLAYRNGMLCVAAVTVTADNLEQRSDS